MMHVVDGVHIHDRDQNKCEDIVIFILECSRTIIDYCKIRHDVYCSCYVQVYS
jgi:hypothetical protein